MGTYSNYPPNPNERSLSQVKRITRTQNPMTSYSNLPYNNIKESFNYTNNNNSLDKGSNIYSNLRSNIGGITYIQKPPVITQTRDKTPPRTINEPQRLTNHVRFNRTFDSTTISNQAKQQSPNFDIKLLDEKLQLKINDIENYKNEILRLRDSTLTNILNSTFIPLIVHSKNASDFTKINSLLAE